MNNNYRIFIERRPRFRVEADSLRGELNANLNLNIGELRLINIYDLFGFSPELLERTLYTVFGDIVTDEVTDKCDTANRKYIAVEFLPGQFDQRAASAEDCVRLIEPGAEVRIRSANLLLFDDTVSEEDMKRIRRYCINAVEAREKDLSVLSDMEQAETTPVSIIEGFRDITDAETYCKEQGLAMNGDDLREVVRYFQREGRDPYQTELRILDTYWSDHCRHTTFMTELEGIEVEESFVSSEIEDSLALYLKIRRELGREHKPICLMDMATIGARYLREKGLLNDLEVSDENNACSIYIDVDVDGVTEKWLLMFKNETHNHPTEIEPFGGASTCVGGAIRDPLSGRAYVYQAIRVTGAGDIYQKIEDTLEGKLPQSVITKRAAAGYSSYGNQIGVAATHVREIYHEGYVAKRMELGAVVGAVKAENVRREKPAAGDMIIMIGGRTGRDGVGGATGSSKEQTASSLETCSSEVQRGNATEERKLQRLFRRGEVARLIKKSNDFGAGGVSVAIGELADGLDIYLDRVKTKYRGLNATELAISESQERMAVVIEPKNTAEFMKYCSEENIEAVCVAEVTDRARMRMFYKGGMVADLAREFIDSAGAKHYAEARIGEVEERNPFERKIEGETLAERFENNLADNNVLSQRGMIEMFDSSIGRSTVLMPFGGRTQGSETQVSVQKIPTEGYTDTASMIAFGYNPFITSWSPYHGAGYAVVEAAAKVVAAGARYNNIRCSYQEYFEKMTRNPESWGKPLSALLGALKMQVELGLPSIGGKDSMSGTFHDINVPPMLMAFGVTTVDASNVISTDFKRAGSKIYLVRHTHRENYMPDTAQLKANFDFVSENIAKGKITSAWAVGFGGVAEGIAKMAFGNRLGARIDIEEQTLFDYNYGSIIVESLEGLNFNSAKLLGEVIAAEEMVINGIRMPLDKLYEANRAKFAAIFPDKCENKTEVIMQEPVYKNFTYQGEPKEHPIAYLPVFPGTNCDYDTAKAFRRAGAEVITNVLRNLEAEDILHSIAQMKEHIDRCNIFVLSGGFSAGDEPDGSAKFIVNILNSSYIRQSLEALLQRGGLILGICNGFQALVKSGLLPYGRFGMMGKDSPTLFRNDINRHISQIVSTRVASLNSPWLSGFEQGETHSVAVSHGEGKFVINRELAEELFANGQVAFQYIDNPNGSHFSIEGLVSPCGQILGKMGHSERYEENVFKNIADNKHQAIFENAVAYFRKK